MVVRKRQSGAAPSGHESAPVEDTDFDTIKAIGRGDRSAFELFVKKYQNPIVNFIFRYVRDRFTAQDLTQEVFLKVFQGAEEFEPRGKVSTWIFTIAFNLCANELKRQKRRGYPHSDLSAVDPAELEYPAHDQAGGRQRELEEDLMAALDRLPENQRAALWLRVNEDLSYLEISRVLNISLAGVESLTFRARKQLRQLMRGPIGSSP
ncbi:MAG: sigma-70 family RNA polymerase sigma factor [Deltaproteobacteria bacterium]|nr:sigma-70 family RNA polymerase sigma factor [Deltaproteobacteria bacterium]